MLNLWEISKSAQAIDHMVSLSLSDTTLQYGYAMDKLSNQVPLVLPALCFCFSTDTIVHTALPVYIVSGMVNAPLPTAAKTFYQIESRQITEAHGGYVEIIENESSLTCLYVLPIQGDKVMRFKNYKPADLVVNKLAETAESLAQEKELITLLPKVTALSEEVVIKTISFIKNAHGLVVRQTGDPYYTHPMTVTTI
ncbi:MAG: hypothetical protein NQ127_03270, partial [Candidatus Cardinium sp.]|nr:hypothetical protein [Candidatus Cardinium sp.]